MTFMGWKTKVEESWCFNVFGDDDNEDDGEGNGFSLDIITD